MSHKLATLLGLLSGQRDQTISKLSINDMALTDDKCIFYVSAILKNIRPSYRQAPTEFLGFPKNEKLLLVKQLLVSFKAPQDAVKTTTVGRWCMETMEDAGIDITVFTSHSTISSSTSKARIKGLSLTMISKSAGGTTDSTFAKFIKNQFMKILEHLLSILNKLNNS